MVQWYKKTLFLYSFAFCKAMAILSKGLFTNYVAKEGGRGVEKRAFQAIKRAKVILYDMGGPWA